jgi:Concanavalin A-like lectin/glucanases superfamily
VTSATLLLVPILLLPIVLLLGFSGCTGEDPDLAAQDARDTQRKQDDERYANENAKREKEFDAEKANLQGQIEAEKKKRADEVFRKRYENQVLNNGFLLSYWRLGDAVSSLVAEDSAQAMPKAGAYTTAGVNRAQPDGALSVGTQSGDICAQFTGNQGYVEIDFDQLLNPPYDFTVELWINPEGNPTAPQTVYGSYELDSAGEVIRGIVIDVLPGSPPDVRVRVGNGASSTALTASLGSGTQYGGWRHVAATYKFGNRTLSLYVDPAGGKPAKIQPDPNDATSPQVMFVENKTASTRIGAGLASNQGPPYPAAHFFKGYIDEVALYNICLDGQDIRLHHLAAVDPGGP